MKAIVSIFLALTLPITAADKKPKVMRAKGDTTLLEEFK
jgi:hypothetical protein